MMQHSKFDGKHQVVIALGQKETVEKIVAFTPAERSVTVLTLEGDNVSFSSLGSKLGILPNATIRTNGHVSLDGDISQTMQTVLFNYYTVKTNITIFDAIKLFFVSRKPSLSDQDSKEITVSNDEESNNRLIANIFVDDSIFSENVSIQVINASGEAGVGKRLERVLTNRGGNVVSIATSRESERLSKITYFGEETYTLSTIQKLLEFPTEKLEKEEIANIVIIIGEDSKNSIKF